MRGEHALKAYMKRAMYNRVRDEVKRARRHAPPDALPEELPSEAPSPADCAIAREDLWRCRVALTRLRPADRQLILAALSGDMRRGTLGARLGKSSNDAARMALTRAWKRLATEMERLAS